MKSKFIIAKVDEVDENLVITASCGSEFKVKAHPVFSIQDVHVDDEVLLIKVSEEFDICMYLLLRLNSDFYHSYKNMVLGFVNNNTIKLKADNIQIECTNLKVSGNIELKDGSITADVIPAPPSGTNGAFNCMKICPYTNTPHTTNTLIIK